MPVRTQNNGPTEGLSRANAAGVVAHQGKTLKEVTYLHLLRVVAETLDACADGTNAWLSIGKNRQGTAFLLTYHEGNDVAYAGGHSLVELSDQCQELLQP